MPYVVHVESSFRARQGLTSTVRSAAGLHSLDEADGRPFVLRVGLVFTDEAVDNDDGRAMDSDIVSLMVQKTARDLSTTPWTTLFDFRPTLERVTRHLYSALAAELPELSHVEIDDLTAGLTVRYEPRPVPDSPSG